MIQGDAPPLATAVLKRNVPRSVLAFVATCGMVTNCRAVQNSPSMRAKGRGDNNGGLKITCLIFPLRFR